MAEEGVDHHDGGGNGRRLDFGGELVTSQAQKRRGFVIAEAESITTGSWVDNALLKVLQLIQNGFRSGRATGILVQPCLQFLNRTF